MVTPETPHDELFDISDEQQTHFVLVPIAEFKRHMEQVNVCVGMLNGVMSAMAQNPMFAGFLPAELRERIAKLSD